MTKNALELELGMKEWMQEEYGKNSHTSCISREKKWMSKLARQPA